MYAGHFAFGLVAQFYLLNINPFLITFGVNLLDIVFGYLANYKYERITFEDSTSGTLRMKYHCPYSHSWLGSIIISILWGCLGLHNNTFVPLFLIAYSHFILDWSVRDKDLECYPYSNIIISSTEFYSRYPKETYYGELIFCILCSAEVLRKNIDNLDFDTHGLLLIVAILYIFYLHYKRRPSAHEESMRLIEKCPDEKRGSYLFLITVQTLFIPAISLGVVLFLFIHNEDDRFSL